MTRRSHIDWVPVSTAARRHRSASVPAATHVPAYPTEAADVCGPTGNSTFMLSTNRTAPAAMETTAAAAQRSRSTIPPISLFAGADNLRTATAKGIPGTLMPAFAASSGGMLTEQQVDALVQGMIQHMGPSR